MMNFVSLKNFTDGDCIYASSQIASGRRARPFAYYEADVSRNVRIYFCKANVVAYLSDLEGEHRFQSKRVEAFLNWILCVVKPTHISVYCNGRQAHMIRAFCWEWAITPVQILEWCAKKELQQESPVLIKEMHGEQDLPNDLESCMLVNKCVQVIDLRQKRRNMALEAFYGANSVRKHPHIEVRRNRSKFSMSCLASKNQPMKYVKLEYDKGDSIPAYEQQGWTDIIKEGHQLKECADTAKEAVDTAANVVDALKPLLVDADQTMDKMNSIIHQIPLLVGVAGDSLTDKFNDFIHQLNNSSGVKDISDGFKELNAVMQNPASWQLAQSASVLVNHGIVKDAVKVGSDIADAANAHLKVQQEAVDKISTPKMLEQIAGAILTFTSMVLCDTPGHAASILFGFLASHGFMTKSIALVSSVVRDVDVVSTVCSTANRSTGLLNRQETPLSPPSDNLEQHGLEQQGFEWAVAPASRLMAVIMAAKCMPEGMHKINSLMSMGLAARSLKSINDLGAMVKEAWRGASEMLYVTFTGLPPSGIDPSYTADVEAWFKFVQEDVSNPLWMSDITTNKAKIDLVQEAHTQGFFLQEQFSRSKTNPALVSAVREHMRVLGKAVDLIKELVTTFDHRVKPTCVLMYGPTGIGKSHMLNYLIMTAWGNALTKDEKKDKTQKDIIYTKSRTSEYWSKYNHQFCTVLDEFNQLATGTTLDTEREIMEIFDLINETDVPLNMPDVESKGKVFFDSDMVVMTANTVNVDLSCITCPAAFRRRIKFIVRPVVQTQFTNTSGDFDPILWKTHCTNNGLDSEKPDWLLFTFFSMDPQTGVTSPIAGQMNISYDAMAKIIIDNLKAERLSAGVRKTALSDYFHRMQQQGLEQQGAGRVFSFAKTRIDQYMSRPYGLDKTLSFAQLKEFIDFGTVEQSAKDWWEAHDAGAKLHVYGKILECHHQDNLNIATLASALNCATSAHHLKLKCSFDEWNAKLSHPPILVSMWTKFKSTWQKLSDKYGLKKWLMLGGTLVGLLIAGLAIFKTYKAISDRGGPIKMLKESFQVESGPSDRTSARVKTRHWRKVNNMQTEALESDDDYVLINNYRMQLRNFDVTTLEQQALLDVAEEDLVVKMIPNLASVIFKDGSGVEKVRTNAMFVTAQWLMVPSHVLKYAKELDRWSLTVTTLAGSLTVDQDEIPIRVPIGDRCSYDDVTLIRMPYPGAYVNLIRRFASEDDMALISEVPGELVVIRPDKRRIVMRFAMNIQQHQRYIASTKKDTTVNAVGSDGKTLVATVGWRYQAYTTKGDCGSPILRMDSRHQTKILGIHCAGQVGYGFGCYVPSNWLDSVVNTTQYQVQSLDLMPYRHGVHPENCVVLGRFEVPLHISRKTDIRRSPLNLWDPKTAPAVLEILDGVDPLKLALDKMVIHHVHMSVHAHIQNAILLSLGSGEPRLLNEFEQLNGLEDDTLKRINVHTSPGIPFVVMGYHGKKKLVIGEEGKYDFSVCLRSRVLEREQLAQKGIVMPALFMDSMKDERRSLEKVRLKKTRLISAAPLDHTVLVRKYFGQFIAHCVAKRHNIPIKVGIDPHSEWTVLYDSLVSKSNQFLAGDIRSMDAHTSPQLMFVFLEIVNAWYDDGPMNAMVREVLMTSIFMPVHVVGEVVYVGLGGNPSGWAGTTILNSINLWIVILNSLVGLTGLHPIRAQREFSLAIYGDDSIVGIPIEYCISPGQFQKAMSDCGFEYTSAKKNMTLTYESIDQVTFLKRSFRKVDGQILPPLDLDTVLEIPLWVRGTSDVLLKIEQNVNDTLLELSYHDCNVVRSHIKRLLSEVFFHDIRLTVPDTILYDMCSVLRQEGSVSDSFFLKLIEKLVSVVPVKKIMALNVWDDLKDALLEPAVWDLQSWCPMLSSNMYYHSGLIVRGGPWSGWHLAFDGSYVICRMSVRPKYTFLPVEAEFVWQQMLTFGFGGYHLFDRNCNHFTRLFLDKRSGEAFDAVIAKFQYLGKSKWPKWHAKYSGAVLSKLHQRALKGHLYEQQGEDNNPKIVNVETVSASELTARTEAELDVERVAISCFTGKISNTGPTPTVRSVLERSELVKTFTWQSEAVGHVLATVDLPFDLLAWVEQFRLKALYNTLMRYNIQVEMKVVSNPFQCGSVMLVWRPMWHLMKETCPEQTFNSKTSNHSTIVYAGGVRRATLIIPYASPQEACNLVMKTDYDKLGVLEVVVVNPLKAGSGTDLRCTIYLRASFTDFEVFGPTSGGIGIAHGEQSSTGCTPVVYQSQADEQQAKSASGIVSGITSVVAAGARMLRGIPIVGDAIGVVGQVAEGVTSLAMALGLSKPTSVESTTPMIPRPFAGACLTDGLDNSQKLAMDPKNEVAIIPCLFGTNVDEMSIPYVIRTPMLLFQQVWNTTTAVNTALFKLPVTPVLGCQKQSLGRNSYQLSHMGWVAMCFKYWRGSINFNVEVVCSEMHRGSVLISFHPYGRYENKDQPLSKISHHILDLSEDNSIDINVPFLSQTPYKKINLVESSNTMGYSNESVTGQLVITVLAALNGPSTVSKTVQVNVWVRAGHDMEFAQPSIESIRYWHYVDEGGYAQQGRFGRAQSQLGPESATLPMFDSVLAGVKGVVMGESIRSLRSLLKIFSTRLRGTVNMHAAQRMQVPVSMVVSKQDEIDPDRIKGLTYLDHVLRIYAMSRGSIRHKWYFPMTNIVATATIRQVKVEDFTGQFSPAPGEPLEGLPWCMTHCQMNPTLEYEAPFYNHRLVDVTGDVSDTRAVEIHLTPLVDLADKKSTISWAMYEAVGDDFSSGCLIGPPLVMHTQYDENMFEQMIAYLEGMRVGNIITQLIESELKDGKDNIISSVSTDPPYSPRIRFQTGSTIKDAWILNRMKSTMWYAPGGKVVKFGKKRHLIRLQSVNYDDSDFTVVTDPLWSSSSVGPYDHTHYFMVWSEIDYEITISDKNFKCKATSRPQDQMIFSLRSDSRGRAVSIGKSWAVNVKSAQTTVTAQMCENTYAPILFDRFYEWLSEQFETVQELRIAYDFSEIVEEPSYEIFPKLVHDIAQMKKKLGS